MSLSDRELYAIVTCVSFVVFLVTFFVSWVVSGLLFRKHWIRFPLFEKADWASRCNSTLHALIVVPGFIITLAMTSWDSNFFETSSVTAIRVIMCISLGYFAFDFLVIVYYRVPLWVVFVVHHIVASIPYYTHLFHPCPTGTFPLAFFLLVEFATFFLNFQVWFEKTGHAKRARYTIMFYTTYVSWFVTRVVLPIFVITIMWNNIVFNEKADDDRKCVIPAMICGHMILLFCVSVFFFVLTPDLVRRWRETPEDWKKREREVNLKRRQSGGGRSFSHISRHGSEAGTRRGSGAVSPCPNVAGASEPFSGQDGDDAQFGTVMESHADFPAPGPKVEPVAAVGVAPRDGGTSPGRHVHITEPEEAEAGRRSARSRSSSDANRDEEDEDEEEEDDDDVISNLSIDDFVNAALSDNPISERPTDRPLGEDVEMRGLSTRESSALYTTTALRF